MPLFLPVSDDSLKLKSNRAILVAAFSISLNKK